MASRFESFWHSMIFTLCQTESRVYPVRFTEHVRSAGHHVLPDISQSLKDRRDFMISSGQ